MIMLKTEYSLLNYDHIAQGLLVLPFHAKRVGNN
jgi:hypothetical protein